MHEWTEKMIHRRPDLYNNHQQQQKKILKIDDFTSE